VFCKNFLRKRKNSPKNVAVTVKHMQQGETANRPAQEHKTLFQDQQGTFCHIYNPKNAKSTDKTVSAF
jgi:DNA/RNA-binding domain of Phe-tRNA-synthetase-like protein